MAGSSTFYFSMILLVMGVAAGTRQLHECTSQGTASADALSQSAVSNAGLWHDSIHAASLKIFLAQDCCGPATGRSGAAVGMHG